jgi:hypothetical protein
MVGARSNFVTWCNQNACHLSPSLSCTLLMHHSTKESLFGGSEEDVQRCNEEHIGFTEQCASCWTVDQLCAKTKCVFIYLQAFMVNQVSNFHVDPNDITTATCDEALCGPEFVPCSGATRRRMDILSDIPRPKDQQCTVANEDWSAIFHHP